MRLRELKKESVMTRRFAFPPDAKPQDRFTVDVSYLSPALFSEKQEATKVKVVNGPNRTRGQEVSEAEFKKALIADVLIATVNKVEGVTIRKLKKLVSLSAEAVAANGGLDAKVEMDLGVPDPSIADAARDNVMFLLAESSEFFNWLINVCTDLGNFQDEDWEAQVENLKRGQATNSAPQ